METTLEICNPTTMSPSKIPATTDSNALVRLKRILLKHTGNSPIMLRLKQKDGTQKRIETDIKVLYSEGFVKEVSMALGYAPEIRFLEQVPIPIIQRRQTEEIVLS